MSISREDILRLARLLESHDCRLVVDESFIEFSRAGGSGSVEGDVAAYPNLVVIKSMSKVFGIAGLRLGYLLSADRAFVRRVRRSLPIWNVNALAEEFLRVVGRYRGEFAESCELTRTTCRELYTDLSALPGLDCVEPDANFVLGRMTDPTATGPDFARRLYVEHNILNQGLLWKEHARREPILAHRVAHSGGESHPRRSARGAAVGADDRITAGRRGYDISQRRERR